MLPSHPGRNKSHRIALPPDELLGHFARNSGERLPTVDLSGRNRARPGNHTPIVLYHRHTLGPTLRLLSVGGPLACGPAQACSGYGGSKPPKWWGNYEP